MSDFENLGAKNPAMAREWVSSVEIRGGGTAYTDHLPRPANENLIADHIAMTQQLPAEIQGAIGEWVEHLRTLPWKIRRRAIKRFAGSFADNFLAATPNLSDDEYQSLLCIGTTCMIEQLDDGKPIQDTHQARSYLESVHEHHQAMAKAYLVTNRPQAATLH